MTEHLHLALALDGYGWHPESWRHTAELTPVTSGRYWSGLATTASPRTGTSDASTTSS